MAPAELNTKECETKGCPGWAVFNNGEVERCDTCKRFGSDDEAIAHVRALEDVDFSRHLDDAAHKALIEVRSELSAVVEEASTNPGVNVRKLVDKLEVLLGRSVWLERHRWMEHSSQFARLLAEMCALGEVTEDAETGREKGYFIVKISDLEESMDLPWNQILSVLERADIVFQSDKQRAH